MIQLLSFPAMNQLKERHSFQFPVGRLFGFYGFFGTISSAALTLRLQFCTIVVHEIR